MSTINYSRIRKDLISLIKNGSTYDSNLVSWSYKGLDQIYKKELEPILDSINNQVLPDKSQMNLVSKVRDEIEGLDFQQLPQTKHYIFRIMGLYHVLEEHKYVQDLETKYDEVKKKLLNPEGFTKKEIGNLKRKMRRLSKKIYFVTR